MQDVERLTGDLFGLKARKPKGNLGEAVARRTYFRIILDEDPPAVPVNLKPDSPHFRKWVVACTNSGIPYRVVDGETDCEIASHREPKTRYETWEELARRVAEGNASLAEINPALGYGKDILERRIVNASILMSGRHLQNGDERQKNREQTVFTNCAASASSGIMLYLMLCGSGVGRDYSDHMMMFNYSTDSPRITCVLDPDHPDYIPDHPDFLTTEQAMDRYGDGDDVWWYRLADTREGWGKAVEKLEVLSYERRTGMSNVERIVYVFNDIRPNGSPILGIGGAPASGPIPLMTSLAAIDREVIGKDMPAWKACMIVDHLIAECVLFGGVRRAARIALKWWKDPDIHEFIDIKRPEVFIGADWESIAEMRRTGNHYSRLWSANNSVIVNDEFRDLLDMPGNNDAKAVFDHVTRCQFYDGTGEPAFLNADMIDNGYETETRLADGHIYSPDPVMHEIYDRIGDAIDRMPYRSIVNPCAEIPFNSLMGFCVIGDIAPYFAESLSDVVSDARVAAAALLRTNLLPSIYSNEVRNVNRIGVGITGIHEFMYHRFGITLRDVLDFNPKSYLAAIGRNSVRVGVLESLSLHEDVNVRVGAFLDFLGLVNRKTVAFVDKICDHAGVNRPSTVMTVKPSGTVSKIFGISEGVHVPDMNRYIRWTQFRDTDPKVEEYRIKGYPVRELKSYPGHVIVGFPTRTTMSEIAGDDFPIASDYSPEDHFRWSSIITFFWLEGGTVEDFVKFLGDFTKLVERRGGRFHGGQVSYTMNIDVSGMSFGQYSDIVHTGITMTRCITMLPKADVDTMSYEYLPNEIVTPEEYDRIVAGIRDDNVVEDVNRKHLECEGGACPIEFSNVA